MFFNPPPILGSVHKISLCQSPALHLGLLPATQHPQSDPQPNFSLGSRRLFSGTILHLTHSFFVFRKCTFSQCCFFFFGSSPLWQQQERGYVQARLAQQRPFHLSLLAALTLFHCLILLVLFQFIIFTRLPAPVQNKLLKTGQPSKLPLFWFTCVQSKNKTFH